MHLADGVLPTAVWGGAMVGAAGGLAASLKRVTGEDIPRLAVVTAAAFVGTLVHIPVGPSSVHLLLTGLVGIVAGRAAFACIFVSLLLQALLFQFGGLLSLGANALAMGTPAVMAGYIFRLRDKFDLPRKNFVFGALAGGLGIVGNAVLLALALQLAGDEFWATAGLILAAHVPVVVIETLIGGFTASFMGKVKPEVLR